MVHTHSRLLIVTVGCAHPLYVHQMWCGAEDGGDGAGAGSGSGAASASAQALRKALPLFNSIAPDASALVAARAAADAAADEEWLCEFMEDQALNNRLMGGGGSDSEGDEKKAGGSDDESGSEPEEGDRHQRNRLAFFREVRAPLFCCALRCAVDKSESHVMCDVM